MSNGPKTSVEILSIVTDYNIPQHIYRVDIGGLVNMTKTKSSTMNIFPQSSNPHWRIYLSMYIPSSEWKNQYQVGHKYDLHISENGDLTLKKSDKT